MTIYAIGGTHVDFNSPDAENALTTPSHATSGISDVWSATLPTGPYMVIFGSPFQINLSQSTSDFWTTYWFNSKQTSTHAGREVIAFSDNGTNVLRFVAINADSFSVDLWTGASWATVIASVTCDNNLGQRYDIHFKMHDTLGEIEIYVDNVLAGSFYGDTVGSTSTTVNEFAINSWYNSTNSLYSSYYSQILVQSDDTRGIAVVSAQANGGTTYADQDSGTVTDINARYGKGSTVDPSKLIFSSANSTSAFATLGIDAQFDTGWQVVNVVTNVRSMYGAASPVTNIAPMVRTATNVDSFATAVASTPLLFKTAFGEFPLNPDTSAAWTVAEAEAASVGVRVT